MEWRRDKITSTLPGISASENVILQTSSLVSCQSPEARIVGQARRIAFPISLTSSGSPALCRQPRSGE